MNKEKNIFDFLNSIYLKNDLKYNKKAAPSYLLCLWLSHDKDLLGIVNSINPYIFLLEDKVVYDYFYHIIPKGRRFVRWTKKIEMSKEQKEQAQKLQEEYQLSKRELEQFRPIFTKREKADTLKRMKSTSKIFME